MKKVISILLLITFLTSISCAAFAEAGTTGYVEAPKNKTAAILLSLFLGGLGVDRFYLGYTGAGLGKLAANVLGVPILAGVAAASDEPAVQIIALLSELAVLGWDISDFIRICTGSLQPAE